MSKMESVHCNYETLFNDDWKLVYLSRIQTKGLGGLRPNTIVLCWPVQWKKDYDTYTADAFVRKFNRFDLDFEKRSS